MAAAPPRFEALTAEYLEGAASAAQREELAELLRADPALQARFVEICRVEGLLQAHFAGAEAEAAFVRRAMDALPARDHGNRTVRGVMRRIDRAPKPAAWLRWAALGAAALLLLGVGVWLGRNTGQPAVPVPGVPVPPGPNVAVNAQAITVASLEGPVTLLRNGARAPAKPGDTLAQGDALLTAGHGRARLVFPGGSQFDVAGGSQPGSVTIQAEASAEGAGYELLLAHASAEGAVTRGAGHGNFVIRTALAEARVTGTRLRISADAGSARLEVYEGKVYFTRLADKQAVPVHANEYADVAPGVTLAAQKSTGRDPALWPFDARSPWNVPLGSNAAYADETSPGLDLGNGVLTQCAEWTHPVYLAAAGDPEVRLIQNSTGKEIFRLRAPAGAKPDSGGGGLIVIDPQRRYALEMNQAFWRGDGNLQAAFASRVDLRGCGVYSEPNGGRVFGGSALGGLIRKGELARGIPHALALSVTHKALNANAPGGKAFVWPACDTMSNPQGRYGSAGNVYMGTLLAIPPDVKLEDLGVGTSGPAYEAAKALQDYGAYVVETFTASRKSVFLFAESACAPELPADFDAKLQKAIQALKVVTNNGPDAVGGGGTPRRPLAPSFKDFSE
ncbi:MAG: FecR domain-containing protein [Planctomycetota bacterium]|nr:FecR domain-containing protein [Planctomycetota bacterium]